MLAVSLGPLPSDYGLSGVAASNILTMTYQLKMFHVAAGWIPA